MNGEGAYDLYMSATMGNNQLALPWADLPRHVREAWQTVVDAARAHTAAPVAQEMACDETEAALRRIIESHERVMREQEETIRQYRRMCSDDVVRENEALKAAIHDKDATIMRYHNLIHENSMLKQEARDLNIEVGELRKVSIRWVRGLMETGAAMYSDYKKTSPHVASPIAAFFIETAEQIKRGAL